MKKTKGFTLIEMVAVIAIMIVLCGLAVPAVSQFIITSRMIQYNDYAKTILLSAQSYLTSVRTAGQLSAVQTAGGAAVPQDQVEAAYYAAETSYLMLSKKGGNEDSYLVTMLQDYVVDPEVLDQTICVEYNARTGMVHSVCYSEVAPAFTYGATNDAAVSIADRSKEARKAGQFGYYSVDLLEPPSNAEPLEESEIVLYDENNQLFCEWTDASPKGSIGYNGEILYKLSIRDQNSGALLMSVEVPDGTVPMYSSLGSFESYKRELTVVNYVNGAATSQKTKCWLYKTAGANGALRFHFVLDMIDTSGNVGVTPVRSITTAFPGIGSRNIVAGISASGDSYAPNNGTTSNSKHSLFGETKGNTAKIESERHLYNIRYGAADMNYTQTKNLDWKSAFDQNQVVYQDQTAKGFPENTGSIEKGAAGACYAFPPAVYTGEARLAEEAFTGSYNGGNHTIKNLYLSGRMGINSSYATRSGLFSINGGTIENLKLEGAALRAGVETSGAIAGTNLSTGSIKKVTVTANQMESTASHLGGFVGLNEGKLEDCSLTAKSLTGKENLGGIAGANTGSITNTTTSVTGNVSGENLVGGITGENTGTVIDAGASVTGNVNGGDWVGGMAGSNKGAITNSTTTVTGHITGKQWVGGITGSNSSNIQKVFATAGSVNGTTEVGGMAGFNSGTIETGTISISQIQGNGMVGGVAGINEGTLTKNGAKSVVPMTITAQTGDFVGGAVGLNRKTSANPGIVENCDLPVSIQSANSSYVGGVAGKNEGGVVTSAGGQNGTLSGNQQVGGLIGENTGTLNLSQKGNTVIITGGDNTGGVVGLNKGTITGVMTTEAGSRITGNNYVGGIIGQNASNTVVTYQNISNKASVKGNSYVGGVIGWNNSVVLTNCSNTGAVEGSGSDVGGIVGHNTVESAEYHSLTNNGSIKGGSYVGGIMGTNLKNTLKNCSNTGNIHTTVAYGGGIVGQNGSPAETSAFLINCQSNMAAKTEGELRNQAAGNYIGGIAGYNNGKITNDKNINIVANIGGVNFVGGIVGHNDSNGVINYCSIAGGNVVATGDFAGGYIGLNTSRATSQGKGMELSSNPTLVTGNRYVGGTIGANLVAADGGGGKNAVTLTVKSNAQNGRIVASAFAGGILGYNGVVESADEGALMRALEALRNPEYDPLSEVDGDANVPVTELLSCSSSLSVTANRFVGGMIGYNSTKSNLSVEECVNNGELSVDTSYNRANPQKDKSYYIGGITGRNTQNGVIKNCYNNGKVISLSKYTGGIVEVNEGKLIKCVNNSKISSTQGYVGGIVGLNGERVSTALVQGCMATPNTEVEGQGDCLGSIVGENRAIIEGCMAMDIKVKSVKGNYVGGIVGQNTGLHASMTESSVLGDKSFVQGGNYVGGIVGRNDAKINMDGLTNSATVRGENYVGGIVGHTTDKGILKMENCQNSGVVAAVPSNYNGSLTDSTQIPPSNSRIEVGGITGTNGVDGVLKDCVNSGTVVGRGIYTGGIVSYNGGTLNNCTSTAKSVVRGAQSAGGIVGLNESTGKLLLTGEAKTLNSKVSSSYNATNGSAYVGGLMAANESADSKTFDGYSFSGTLNFESKLSLVPTLTATADVGQYAGGILGKNREKDTLSNCSFTGTITGGNGGSGGIVGINYGTVQNIQIGTGSEKPSITGYVRAGGISGVSMPGSSTTNVQNGSKLSVHAGFAAGGIHGLYYAGESGASFEKMQNNATVQALGAAGGLIGELKSNSNVEVSFGSCTNNGTVIGGGAALSGFEISIHRYRGIGGIVGLTEGATGLAAGEGATVNFNSCSNDGTVVGVQYARGVGGIIGMGYHMNMLSATDCVNNKTVSGESAGVGGIVGASEDSNLTVKNCKNNEIVTGETPRIDDRDFIIGTGGIVGVIGGYTTEKWVKKVEISLCANEGKVTGKGSGTGGVIGTILTQTTYDGYNVMVDNCTNGTVNGAQVLEGANDTGGILGRGMMKEKESTVEIQKCMNYIRVTTPKNQINVGGILGSWNGTGLLISEGENHGEVNIAGKNAGGIAGNIVNSGAKKSQVSKCVNDKAINAGGALTNPDDPNETNAASAGGIVGTSQNTGTGSVEIQNCNNKGSISSVNGSNQGFQVGGILGSATGGAVNLTECTNEKVEGASIEKAKGSAGGIAGYYKSTGSIIKCVNNMPFNLSDSIDSGAIKNGGAVVGGIVGYWHSGTLDGCTNNGEITSKEGGVGGIVGVNLGQISVMTGCINNAAITITGGSATDMVGVGGLMGYYHNNSSGPLTMIQSTNNGKIEIKSSGNGNSIGGVLGLMSTSVEANKLTLDQLVNTGEVVVEGSGKTGGIIGWMRRFGTPDLNIKNCANFAPVTRTANGGSEIGGIVGKAEYTTIQSCYNFGTIDSKTAGQDVGVGGIAGTIYHGKARILNCINVGSVGNSVAQRVGGIAGVNKGEVVSCQNLAYADLSDQSDIPAMMTTLMEQAERDNKGRTVQPTANPSIQGSQYVGGIAGVSNVSNVRETGLIYSDTTGGEYRITKNFMPIFADSRAGGIAGELKGGSVTVALNSGSVTTTKDCAGGIVGSAASDANQGDGGISGAFNLGAVTSLQAGGLVGARETSSRDSFPIQDGFFIASKVKETTVDRLTGNWRVGNEPYGAEGDKGGSLDGPKDQTTMVVMGSNMQSEKFKEMYPEVAAAMTEPVNMDTLINVVETALKKYVVKLGAPQIISINTNTVTSGNGYTTDWAATTGATSGYDLRYKILATKSLTSDQIGDFLPVGTFLTEMDRRDTRDNNFFKEENIGRYFTVQAMAKGKQLGSGDSEMKTDDSDWSNWYGTPQLIIPPMLAPEISVLTKEGTSRSFSVVNLDEYAEVGKPKATHPNLGNITETGYAEAYEKYENGLVSFVMTVEGDKNTYPLVKNEDGTYTCDYNFVLEDGVTKKTFKVTVKAVPKTNPSAYYINSTTIPVEVVKTIKLVVSEPKLTYNGTTVTADYQFSCKGHEKASSYDFWLTNEDGVEIYRGSLPKGTSPKVNLSTLKDFNISDYYGKEITAHVKAIGDGQYYLDSEEVKVTTKVVEKLAPPTITAERLKNADGSVNDQYKLSWAGGSNAGFSGTVTQTEAVDPVVEKVTTINRTDKEKIFDYAYRNDQPDTEIINQFSLNASIKQLGVLGTSLDSEPGTLAAPYLVQPRLVINRNKSPLAIGNETGQPLQFTFDWTDVVKDKGLMVENCAGYKLYMTIDGIMTQFHTETDLTKTTHEYLFTEDLAGKKVEFYLCVIGKDGKSSDSLDSGTATFFLPKKILQPLNVNLVKPAEDSKPLAEFGDLSYGLTWTVNPGNESSYYSGFTVEVLDGTTLLKTFTPVGQNAEAHNFKLKELSETELSETELEALAGKTLTIRIRTKSLLQLSSDWVVKEVTLPKILLDSPKNLTYEAPTIESYKPGEMGTLRWDVDSKASGYRVDYTLADGSTGTIPEADMATPGSCPAVKNMKEVRVVALGDDVIYKHSNPTTMPFDPPLAPKPFPDSTVIKVGYANEAIQWKHVGDYVGSYSLKLTMAYPPVSTFAAEPEATGLEWNPFSSLMIVAGETAVETAELPAENGAETLETAESTYEVECKIEMDLTSAAEDSILEYAFADFAVDFPTDFPENLDKTLLRGITVIAHTEADEEIVWASEPFVYDSMNPKPFPETLESTTDEAVPPEMMLPSTPIVPEGTVPEGDKPATPDGNEPVNPDESEPTTPDGSEPTTPDGSEPAPPDSNEPAPPDSNEPATPSGSESTIPEESNSTSTEPTAPEETESSGGESGVSVLSMTLCAGAITSLAGVKRKSKKKTK